MEIGHKILLRNVQSVGSELIVSNVTFQLLKNWVERILYHKTATVYCKLPLCTITRGLIQMRNSYI